MSAPSDHGAQIDSAAFGVMYGTITVIALLMAIHLPVEQPWGEAFAVLGSVFAVAIAKAFAEVCDKTLSAGKPADREMLRSAWHHGRTVLLAANIPALAFALAGLGLLPNDLAFSVARFAAFGILFFYGARIGWRLKGSILLASLSGAGIASLGLGVSALKVLAR